MVCPNPQRPSCPLLEEHHLPVLKSNRRKIAVVGHVEEEVPGALLGFAKEPGKLVVSVEVDLVSGAVQLDSGLELVGDVGNPTGG